MIGSIQEQLNAIYPIELVNLLLDSHKELTNNFIRGKIRPTEVEGGRFCETVLRMLQYKTSKSFTPLGTQIKTDDEIDKLEKLPRASYDDTIRLHIPRTVRLIYDIRNKRDSAHLGRVSVNLMDATLVLYCCKWILAELFRIDCKIPMEEAQKIIDNLVERNIPIIQKFDNFPVTLNPALSARERMLILLYDRGADGATKVELTNWIPPSMKNQISSNINRLRWEKNYIHVNGDRIFITLIGEKFVEDNLLPN